jgi:hypothetical protein
VRLSHSSDFSCTMASAMLIFWIDGNVLALHAEERADGGVLDIHCRHADGSNARLRLQFTSDGVDRFSDIVSKFVHSCRAARSDETDGQRTAAAEPTSVGAKDAESRHVRRYLMTRIHPDELKRFIAVTESYDAGASASEVAGSDRVVIWRISDEPGGGPGGTDCRLYLSPGAVRAATREGVHLEPLGDVSWHDLPKIRQLLVGDPPLDWQDTSFISSDP